MWALAALMVAGCATAPRPRRERVPSDRVAPEVSPMPDPRALAWYAQGLVHEWGSRWEEAEAAYRKVQEHDPSHLEAVFRQSVVKLRRQRASDAIALMESLRRDHPQNTQVLTWLAQIYGATQNQAKAREVLELIVQLDPGRTEAHAQLGAVLAATGREDEAIEALETGSRQALEPGVLYRMLADLYLRRTAAETRTEEQARLRGRTIEVLERLVEEEPDNVLALRRLAELNMQAQDMAGAVAVFERIEALGAADPRIRERMAAGFLALGEEEKAVETLEVLAARPGARSQVHQFLGELHLKLENREKALQAFALAAEAPGADATSALRLALLQLDDDPDAAVATLQRGIRAFPGDLRLVETLAYVELTREGFAQAYEWFGKAERLIAGGAEGPTSPAFHASYAVAALEAGQEARARSLAAEAFSRNPEQLEVFVQYATRKDLERPERYRAVLDALGELYAADARLKAVLATYYHFQEKHEESLPLYEAAERLARESADPGAILTERFLFMYGAASERAKRIEQAEALFKRVLEMDPEHHLAANYLAYMWAERGLHLDEAMRLVDIALQHEPDSAAYIDTKGWIYFMRGDYEEAYPLLRRAYDMMSDDPVVSEHYGDVLHKLGREEEAVEIWKKSLGYDLDDREELEAKLTEAGVDVAALRAEIKAAQEKDAGPDDADTQPPQKETRPDRDDAEPTPTPEPADAADDEENGQDDTEPEPERPDDAPADHEPANGDGP